MAKTKWIKMLDAAGSYKKGQKVETDESSADFLIDKGLAEPTDAKPTRATAKKAAAVPAARPAKRAAAAPSND